MNKSKIAIVVSHPIQHFCPWYAHLAQSPLWDLTVFFATDAGQKPYFDKAFGKEVHWSGLDLSFKHVFLNQGGGGATDAVGLEEELDALSPDAIMIYGYSNRLSRRAYRWARAHNKPIMYQSDSELRHSRRLLGRIAKRSYLPRFFRHVDLFFTVGDANEQYLEHYQADSLRFVRSSFPIDIDSFSAAYDARSTLRATIRNIHGISDDDTVVSVVGKLIPIKDHDCLIKAIHHLDDSPARIVLLIIGSGPEEAALKARAFEVKNQRIIFTGFINVDELPAYYAATDIYVHPSSVEPHSLSISEAMYMGCPLVISDRCGSWGPTDDLRPGVNGLVFPTGNSQALAATIARLAENQDLRDWLGSNSRQMGLMSQENIHFRTFQAALVNLGLM